MTDASAIAEALGLRRSGRAFTGACPCCCYRGFEVQDRDGCTLVKCFAGGCEQAQLLEALRRRGLWGGTARWDRHRPAPRDRGGDIARNTAAALRLWRRRRPAEGTVVETYLRARGITISAPPTVGCLAAATHPASGLTFPVMIAAVACVSDNRVVAIHRTFLRPDGSGKADVPDPKCSLGPIGGGAVRLAPLGPSLQVAEGIETALTVMQATAVPTWAALTAGGIARLVLPPLPLAAEVIIAADRDASGVGQRAAQVAAQRWLAEGRRVRIALPPEIGVDFNDLLCAARGVGYGHVA